MYPDVFGPRFEFERLDAVVDFLLRSFREQALPRADIGPDVPIRICENGWPTAAGCSEERRADVLETVLRAVHAGARELNVTHWELFSLRDADSSKDDLFHNIQRHQFCSWDRLGTRIFDELSAIRNWTCTSLIRGPDDRPEIIGHPEAIGRSVELARGGVEARCLGG